MLKLPLLAVALVAAFLPAACSRLPGGAPASEEILKSASEADADFALYAVTRAFLPTVAQWPVTGKTEQLNWIGASRGPKSQIIQPGDRLSMQIWDSNTNSLLTSGGQKAVQLQDMRVSANGSVFLPYVGDVTVMGLTPAACATSLSVMRPLAREERARPVAGSAGSEGSAQDDSGDAGGIWRAKGMS